MFFTTPIFQDYSMHSCQKMLLRVTKKFFLLFHFSDVRSSCDKSMQAMMQLIQMSTHQRKCFLMAYPARKACGPLTLKTVAFTCNFVYSLAAMIAPHYHSFLCNVYM